MANKSSRYVDAGWPDADGGHAVTELSSARTGGLSPYGDDTEFPLAASELPYVHPYTVISR
jgi:hypothetical protein